MGWVEKCFYISSHFNFVDTKKKNKKLLSVIEVPYKIVI